MKKLILFAVLAIVFASCKKSSSSSPVVNTITATINDTPYAFSQDILDTTVYQSSDSDLLIQLEAKDFNLNTFVLVFGQKNKPFSAGTIYGSFGDSVHLLIAGMEPFNTSAYSSGPYPNISSSSALVVTLTSITPTNIQGTFKGDIYLDGDTTQAKKTVTNGTFNFTKALTVQ